MMKLYEYVNPTYAIPSLLNYSLLYPPAYDIYTNNL